ncbi:hypothetical protein QRO11_12220 [Paracidovorax citrulli]|uniref:hypothetical protein n=1 Tax=Paracidovorax citrulli TaxID=80869 RepID=UPI000A6724B7|nr:hypothetical protein [Paracidovorax citrulli]WIY32750.1 hypothetical protein QRO11_12220 [Paracidovorax citrulli]
MDTNTTAASGAAQSEALRLAAIVNSDGYITNIERRQIAAELRRQHALATAAPAAKEAAGTVYAEVRQCSVCDHIGINDATNTSACTHCDWHGPSPTEDLCPGCGQMGSMTMACPECGHRTHFLVNADLPVTHPRAAAQEAEPALDESEAEDLARSAFETAMSYGVDFDAFRRLAMEVRRRCCSAPRPQEDAGAVRAVLEQLERANDDLCALRTQEQYLSMIDSGQQEALEALDDARRAARAALAAAPQTPAAPNAAAAPGAGDLLARSWMVRLGADGSVPAPTAGAAPTDADTVDVVGVRASGEHVNLGKMPMPPTMKARDIATSQFGGFQDGDGSDAEMCFGALEELLAWLIAQGWGAAAPAQEAELRAEVDRLNAIINTPQADDFLRAVSTEAEHQRQRWPSEHDEGKTPADWFWLVGYLAGKALHAHAAGNAEKAEHHIITTAAALANWHLAVFGKTNMRPGIDAARAQEAEDAEKGGPV